MNFQRDDFGGEIGKELSEDVYDALNDETFTHATTDDWEGIRKTDKIKTQRWIFKII